MGDMDSASSESTQSSSGGEEEYDSSRNGGAGGADSFSYVFHQHQHQNHHGYPPAGHVTNPPPPSSYFDPLASYLDHLSRSPTSSNPNPIINNPDPGWPKDLGRSNQTASNITSQSMQPQTQLARGSADHHHQPNQVGGGGVGAVASGRNPKKRTRASRRAPTNVLTTDTSNFRAMVQEFTGIPAPPFGSSASSSSLLFPRTRFDVFGNRRSPLLVDAMAPPPLPAYLLRPFAQKIPTPPPPPPAAVSLPFVCSTTLTSTSTTTTADIMSTSSGNYQIPSSNSELGLLATMPFNLSFSSDKYPSSNPDPRSPRPVSGGFLELPVATRNESRSQPRAAGALMDEFAHDDHDQLGGLTASLLTTAAASGAKNNPLGWAEGLGLGAADAAAGGSRPGNGGNANHSHHLRLGNDINSTAVESWICSSTDRLA